MNKDSSTLKFGINDAPFSADTLEYDYFVHHQIFRSVLGSLVSVYSKGAISPFVAKEWMHENNKRRWKFIIRENLLFENGDRITPKIVYKSFCRMAFLQKKKNSNSGLLEYLVGFDEIKDIESCEGITYSENAVEFTFSKSLENVLETIAFGQYSIVHPSDYDKNGDWINPKKVTSSSFYSINHWNNNLIQLSLRDEFNIPVGHHNKASKIDITWGDSKDLDIKKTTSLYSVPDGWAYVGGAQSNIIFLRLTSWKNKKSPFNKKETRLALRSKVYDYLKGKGYELTMSFFPKGIEGIEEIDLVEASGDFEHNFSELNFAPFRDPPGNIGSELVNAIKAQGLNIVKLTSPEKFETLNPNLDSYNADLIAMGTGILIDKPDDDVRFMFLSKEGIRLPDESGEITKLLEKESLDLQEINKLIFEQSIIWPITHYSDGVVVNSRVDTSQLNIIYPPIDFSFIGIK